MDWILSGVEARVLGVLIEKELSTPDYYPMTLNALTAACNQKTNRDPVVEYGEEDVTDAVHTLQQKRLAGTASGGYSRVAKYRHTLAEQLALAPPALAVLAELLLRGPQTVGELRARTGRMVEFASLEAVEAELQALMAREAPLVAQLPRQPGRKEIRYAHLLCGEPAAEPGEEPASPAGGDRLSQLEAEVALLRERLEKLEAALERFQKQFE